ncbi:MAG: phospholipid carrier-dependent glycosyltransferase [Anaerolineae bacterium]
MTHRTRLAWLPLAVLIAVYLATATQYALLTPPWQAPDEPAHYNYVRYIAERGALPVLRSGDYPAAYLEEIKARGFPPEMSIDPLQYESWQPPLYYVLAAPLYRAALAIAPHPLPLIVLRLLSVLLGALLIAVTYLIARELLPQPEPLALGAASVLATLPMQVAMTAAVNNDTLAGLWSAVIVWQLLRLLRSSPTTRQWQLLGLTIGLGALTKLSTLATLPLVGAVVCYTLWQQAHTSAAGRAARWRPALAVALPALLLIAPWVLRNVVTYGVADPLIMARHSSVVAGQLRTEVWLAQVGLPSAVREMARTTFYSFWGQFGWMGVPLPDRLYTLLAAGCGLCALGLAADACHIASRWGRLTREAQVSWCVILGWLLLTAASYLWYNLSFKQHQGRYLFPALPAIALLLAVGWWRAMRRSRRWVSTAYLLVLTAILVATATRQGHAPDKRLLAALAILSAATALAAVLPERWGRWLYALPYPLFVALDLLCLYAFIRPALS